MNSATIIDKDQVSVEFRRVERARQFRAFCFTLPLLLFLIVSFVAPILSILFSSVHAPGLADTLPRAARQLTQWDGRGSPPQGVFSALAQDLLSAERIGTASGVLNSRITGYRSLLTKTTKQLKAAAERSGTQAIVGDPRIQERFASIDPRWMLREYWATMRQAAPRYTLYYLLRGVDLTYDIDGNIERVPELRRIYLAVAARTIWICTAVTLLSLLVAFPIAHLLARLPSRQRNVGLLFLIMPLWISVLVKSSGWLVLLQDQGVLNDAATGLGLWNTPVQLIHNRIGTYFAMVHYLVPYMALPLFAVMKGIDQNHLRAAAILGAGPARTFAKVYLPQALPGVVAGVLIVFVLALGLYVPPALVGGPTDEMLSGFIASGFLRAPLSVNLLVIVALFMFIFKDGFKQISRTLS